ASLRRFGTRQRNQFGFLLTVKNGRNSRRCALLAAQHGLEALFHQLLAAPVDHGWAGIQGLNDPAITPTFTGLRDIGLQQYPGLQQPARRALSLPNQRFNLLALLAAQPHNMRLYRNLLHSHDLSPSPIVAMATNHQILSNWLKRAT